MSSDLNSDDIKKYLPQFLSGGSQSELFSCLRDFPKNIDQRFYSDVVLSIDSVVQGDGLSELLFVEWKSLRFNKAPAIVLSNSCDISEENPRYTMPFACYCPIISFTKYLQKLKDSGIDVNNLEKDIKAQRMTSMFYLPKGQNLVEDKIVLLDRVQSCPNSNEQKQNAKKLFSLSNYGFYLFLLKISIHFTRIRDGIDRISIAT